MTMRTIFGRDEPTYIRLTGSFQHTGDPRKFPETFKRCSGTIGEHLLKKSDEEFVKRGWYSTRYEKNDEYNLENAIRAYFSNMSNWSTDPYTVYLLKDGKWYYCTSDFFLLPCDNGE